MSAQRITRSVIGLTLLLAVVGISIGAVVYHRGRSDAAPSVKPKIGAAVPSHFTFTGLVDWWQGATNENSMALFYRPNDCFTSVQYKPGAVDVAAELQKIQNDQTGAGLTATPQGIQQVALQASTGSNIYELHAYNLSSNDSSEKLLSGLEMGYIQFAKGYVQIEGHCATVGQLSATVPALQAIRFDENTLSSGK